MTNDLLFMFTQYLRTTHKKISNLKCFYITKFGKIYVIISIFYEFFDDIKYIQVLDTISIGWR